jgi:hypothetical protein
MKMQVPGESGLKQFIAHPHSVTLVHTPPIGQSRSPQHLPVGGGSLQTPSPFVVHMAP